MILKNLDRFGSEKLETIKAKASAFRDRVAADGGDTRVLPEGRLL